MESAGVLAVALPTHLQLPAVDFPVAKPCWAPHRQPAILPTSDYATRHSSLLLIHYRPSNPQVSCAVVVMI